MTTKLTFVRFHCDIHTAQQFPRNRPDHKLGRPETVTLIYVNISGYPVFIKNFRSGKVLSKAEVTEQLSTL